jgi:protein phosphatase
MDTKVMQEGEFLHETDLSHVPFASLSHQGKVRQNNEDRLVVRNYVADELQPRHVLLAVLSDGVGGNRAGEIAAQIGVDTIVGLFGNLGSLDHPAASLKEVVIAANLAVLEASAVKSELEGMGATCICALVIEKTLYLASLGDSRAYLLRGRTIRQLNYDHTWLEDKAGIGISGSKNITRDHPLAHVLSRYLGSAHPAWVDMRQRPEKKLLQNNTPTTEPLELLKGDHVLLCSDGLTDMLTDGEIRSAIKRKMLQKDVQQLVLCALEKGGHDNVSVILMKIP